MNLHFVRQAIYQRDDNNKEKEVKVETPKEWEVKPLPEQVMTQKNSFPKEAITAMPSGFEEVEADPIFGDEEGVNTSDFRLSNLLDSQANRVEEKKEIQKFRRLQDEAKVIKRDSEEALIAELESSALVKKPRRQAVTKIEEEIKAASESSGVELKPDKVNLLGAYESSDDSDG